MAGRREEKEAEERQDNDQSDQSDQPDQPDYSEHSNHSDEELSEQDQSDHSSRTKSKPQRPGQLDQSDQSDQLELDQLDQSDQSDHTKPQPYRPVTVSRPIYKLVNTYKMGEGSGSRNQLPESMKLKGEENYTIWKELIQNMAVANDLRQFIHEKGRVPKYIDEFDEKADTARLAV